ncbi:MAG TPA: SDR family oxidoreductase [Stellaceae bacterium]|jgi:NAD(P)-dependent dehydrogenase (short-subunit alcohol dehydrogenase family)
MKDMSERVAVVTGASSGIGAAICRKFAGAGIKTVLAARSVDKLETVAREITESGGTALVCPADVTSEPHVVQLFERTMAAYGRVDILVNNAGLADHIPTVELSLADWRRSIDTMLTGPFLCGREAMRIMVKQKRGRIINIGSVSSRRPRPHTIGYAAAKFGLHGITQSMALDGREHGITVSIIDPGVTESHLARDAAAPKRPPTQMMQADEIGEIALLIARLPDETNLMEAFVLPIGMPFLGRS